MNASKGVNAMSNGAAGLTDQAWVDLFLAGIPKLSSPLEGAVLIENEIGARHGPIPRERLALLALGEPRSLEVLMMWASEAYSAMEPQDLGFQEMRGAGAYCVGLAIGAEVMGRKLAARSGATPSFSLWDWV